MTEPVKYLTIVGRVLELFQSQLLNFYKRSPQQPFFQPPDPLLFKAKFDHEYKRLRDLEDEKSIVQDRVSDIVEPTLDFFHTLQRNKNSSLSDRYALRSSLRTQDSHRMRLTGGLKKGTVIPENQTINESVQLDEVSKSYKIQQQIGPRMRMKWKSLKNSQQQEKNSNIRKAERGTIGDNNIDLLSYTIPQIENSIKRLSLQSVYAKQRSPERIFESYRTIDTRGQNRKKYVSRLI